MRAFLENHQQIGENPVPVSYLRFLYIDFNCTFSEFNRLAGSRIHLNKIIANSLSQN